MAIDKMNLHYSFTNPASVYDEEALTALELAGRQGAKINELVDEANALRTETETHLANQDDAIENHKNVVIPNTVEKSVEKHIRNGAFDEQIETHNEEFMKSVGADVATLEGRMNAFTSLGSGSTTGDAELIDARVSADGFVHSNAGNAIRAQTEELMESVEAFTERGLTYWVQRNKGLNANTGALNDNTGRNIVWVKNVDLAKGIFVNHSTSDYYVNGDLGKDGTPVYYNKTITTSANTNNSGAYCGFIVDSSVPTEVCAVLVDPDLHIRKDALPIPSDLMKPENLCAGYNNLYCTDYNATYFKYRKTAGANALLKPIVIDEATRYSCAETTTLVYLYNPDGTRANTIWKSYYDATENDIGCILVFLVERLNNHTPVVYKGTGGVKVNSDYLPASGGKWNGKKVLFMGDSLTAANQFQNTVKNILGVECYNHCVGGASMEEIVDGNEEGTLGAITADKVADKDLIVFYAGYNNRGQADGNVGDCYNPNGGGANTIAGRVQYAINRIYECLTEANNLTCKLLIVTVDCAGTYSYIDVDGYGEYPSGSGRTMETLANTQKAVAEYNSIPCCDLWHNSGINRNTWSVFGASETDKLHKSAKGYERIGECIAGAIIHAYGN